MHHNAYELLFSGVGCSMADIFNLVFHFVSFHSYNNFGNRYYI